MRSNFFLKQSYAQQVHLQSHVHRYTNVCTHVSTHTVITDTHTHRWWGLPVMVQQVVICVPPRNKALSKLQDLCTFPLWSPPVSVMFSKVQVPKILIQFPSETSKNRKGELALWFFFFFFKFCSSYIVLLSKGKQNLIRGSFWLKFRSEYLFVHTNFLNMGNWSLYRSPGHRRESVSRKESERGGEWRMKGGGPEWQRGSLWRDFLKNFASFRGKM